MPALLRPIIDLNPLTYTTAIFCYLALQMGKMSSAELVNAGVAFNIKGFVILPGTGLLVILAICLLIIYLCVKQFNKTDFSQVKVYRH